MGRSLGPRDDLAEAAARVLAEGSHRNEALPLTGPQALTLSDLAAVLSRMTRRAERYKVERKFGGAKRWRGFGRCRCLGLVRYGLQAQLTALVLNLKRIVMLLTGVRLRPTRHTTPALAA